jgi:hypothetical protein
MTKFCREQQQQVGMTKLKTEALSSQGTVPSKIATKVEGTNKAYIKLEKDKKDTSPYPDTSKPAHEKPDEKNRLNSGRNFQQNEEKPKDVVYNSRDVRYNKKVTDSNSKSTLQLPANSRGINSSLSSNSKSSSKMPSIRSSARYSSSHINNDTRNEYASSSRNKYDIRHTNSRDTNKGSKSLGSKESEKKRDRTEEQYLYQGRDRDDYENVDGHSALISSRSSSAGFISQNGNSSSDTNRIQCNSSSYDYDAISYRNDNSSNSSSNGNNRSNDNNDRRIDRNGFTSNYRDSSSSNYNNRNSSSNNHNRNDDRARNKSDNYAHSDKDTYSNRENQLPRWGFLDCNSGGAVPQYGKNTYPGVDVRKNYHHSDSHSLEKQYSSADNLHFNDYPSDVDIRERMLGFKCYPIEGNGRGRLLRGRHESNQQDEGFSIRRYVIEIRCYIYGSIDGMIILDYIW